MVSLSPTFEHGTLAQRSIDRHHKTPASTDSFARYQTESTLVGDHGASVSFSPAAPSAQHFSPGPRPYRKADDPHIDAKPRQMYGLTRADLIGDGCKRRGVVHGFSARYSMVSKSKFRGLICNSSMNQDGLRTGAQIRPGRCSLNGQCLRVGWLGKIWYKSARAPA